MKLELFNYKIGNLESIFDSKFAKQSGLLIGTQGFAMLLSMVFTLLITKGLSVADYGKFRYLMTYLALAMTLLQFGWPNSAARLLALENDHNVQKQIVGACALMVIISSSVGTAITIAVFILAEALGHELPRMLLLVTPFLYVTLSQYMIGSICQGLNKIFLYSLQQALPYSLLIPITAVQMFVIGQYSLYAALVGYIAVFSLIGIFGFFQLRFSFIESRRWLGAIFKENRRTGFPMYIGGVFGVASGQIIAMWVAEFTSPSSYGHYALALAVSAPLSILVSSVGTVVFRSCSRSNYLSNRVLFFSFGLGISLGLLYFFAIATLLVRMFGNQYNQSVHLAQLLGFGSLMVGWGDIFNRFMSAHGKGRSLCIVVVSNGMIGILSAAILLPKWNIYGAAISSIIAAVTYLILMVILYIRFTSRLRRNLIKTDTIEQLV